MLGWPNPVKEMDQLKLQKFDRAFMDILCIQHPNDDQNVRGALDLAMGVMLEPVLVKFYYHFGGNRPTNRIDRPEWFFTMILNSISDHQVFLDEECQPLVLAAGIKDRSAKVCCVSNRLSKCLLVGW